jgi:hypothetical protein
MRLELGMLALGAVISIILIMISISGSGCAYEFRSGRWLHISA